MKKAIFTFIIAALALSMQAQIINFENGWYHDLIQIDSTNPNNIWQIGQPQKIMFDSAFSLPNAIVTDTAMHYPTNNHSVFYLIYPYHDPGFWPGLFFQYKIQTDTLLDFGHIEASYDNGNTWVDIIGDANEYDIQWYVLGQELPGGNHEVIASSYSDTLPFTGLSNTWFEFEITMFGWDQYFPSNDTIIYKVSFHSDGIVDNKEGWMIDNIQMGEYYMGLEDEKMSDPLITVYPNPCTNQISFKLTEPGNIIEHIKIFDINGRLVKNLLPKSADVEISLEDLKTGQYLFQATDGKGEVFSGKFLKK